MNLDLKLLRFLGVVLVLSMATKALAQRRIVTTPRSPHRPPGGRVIVDTGSMQSVRRSATVIQAAAQELAYSFGGYAYNHSSAKQAFRQLKRSANQFASEASAPYATVQSTQYSYQSLKSSAQRAKQFEYQLPHSRQVMRAKARLQTQLDRLSSIYGYGPGPYDPTPGPGNLKRKARKIQSKAIELQSELVYEFGHHVDYQERQALSATGQLVQAAAALASSYGSNTQYEVQQVKFAFQSLEDATIYLPLSYQAKKKINKLGLKIQELSTYSPYDPYNPYDPNDPFGRGNDGWSIDPY